MSDCTLECVLYLSTQRIHCVQELLQAFVHLQNHTDSLLPAQIPKHVARFATRCTDRIDDCSAIYGFLNDHIRRHLHCEYGKRESRKGRESDGSNTIADRLTCWNLLQHCVSRLLRTVASGLSISSTAFPHLVNQSILHHFQHDQHCLWKIETKHSSIQLPTRICPRTCSLHAAIIHCGISAMNAERTLNFTRSTG